MIVGIKSYVSTILYFSFFVCPVLVYPQNLKKTDSLLRLLHEGDLSKVQHSKLLLDIAVVHPDLDTALFFAKQSLQMATEIQDPILQSEALEEISLKERKLGNNSTSFQASLKALQIYESLGMVERQAASYSQLANNYITDEDFDMAIGYLKKAKNIYLNSDKKEKLMSIIHNLGEAYRLAGHLDSSTTCFRQTLKLNEPIKNEYIESYTLGNLGMVYSAQNNLIAAKENLNDAIKILTAIGDPYSTSIYLTELGKIHKREGKLKPAEEKFLKALTMAKQAGLKEQIRDFSVELANFYETQQKYPEALKYQKLYQVYQDSLVNKGNIQKIERLKAGYEIDKRELKIGLLNTINTNQKYLVSLLAIGVFSLLFFAYLLYRGNKKIKKANTVLSDQKGIITKREQEKALLLRELNHRVKNNLQMISSLLNLQGHELSGHPAQEAIVAGKYRVEALSLIHRKLYQEGLDTRVLVKEYIEELVLGLFHGYGAKFKPDFEIANISIHIDTAVPLALIINEVIINSLKYAYQNIDHPTLKIIVVQADNNRLDMQVIDNGIGFTTIETKKTNSFGIKLIFSLIEQLEGTIEKSNSNGTHWKMNMKTA